MKRSGVTTGVVLFALVWGIAALALAGTARPAAASVFCAAAVNDVVAWDVPNDRAGDGRPTRLYGFSIGADAGVPISGTMMVVTDSKAYAIRLTDLRFAPDPDNPKEYYSSGHMFALPESAIVRYAWVDATTDPQTGKNTTCVTVPTDVQANPAFYAAGAPGKSLTLESYGATVATFAQNLPKMTCGVMYTKPEAISIPKSTQYFDSSQGRNAKPVHVRIDLSSDGHAVFVAILQSSGAIPVDAAAVDAFQQAHYKPATFLCSPVASSLYYEYDYSLQ